MNKMSRRDALTGIIGAGAAALTMSDTASAISLDETPPPAFAGKHTPKSLPFDAAKLKGISEKLITSHHDNNYVAAVKALNVIEARLIGLTKEKNLPAYIYGDLKRQELIRTGSIVLHENYFGNLGGNGKADGKAKKLIEQWFGSYEAWEAEFKLTGNALGGGSGWTILGFNQHTREVHNYWSSDHSTNPPFTTPLLVLDMYEHAYQMDYGAAAGKYIDAFMTNVNWEEVNRRVEASKI
ncbi:Fe-Mn family superoxide dismutase [soil metagenome]